MYHPKHARPFYRVDRDKFADWLNDTMQWLPCAVIGGVFFAALICVGLVI